MEVRTMEQNKYDIDGWLVTLPPGQKFTAALTSACRGNEDIANVLNYFLYGAAYEAKIKQINKNEVEYIELTRKLDHIVCGLNNHNKSASKKTIHDRIKKLQTWGFIFADGYHLTYRVYFRKVEAACINPPEPEKPKLRGRHVRRLAEQTTTESDYYKERNFNSKVKSTISAQNEGEENVNLTEEMSKLQSKMLDLTSQMSNLTSQMLDLTSSLARERALREALEAKLAAIYSNNTVIDTVNNTVMESDANTDSNVANKSTKSNGASATPMPSSSSQKKSSKNNAKPPKAIKVTGLAALSPEDRHFWDDLWLQVDQNKKAPPKYTDTAGEHIPVLRPLIQTIEDLQSLVNFARKKLSERWGRDIWKVELGNLRTYYSEWDRLRQKEAQKQQQPETEEQEDENALVLWTKHPDHEGDAISHWYLYEKMPLKIARQYQWDPAMLPGTVEWNILLNWEKAKRGEIQVPKITA